MNLGSDGPLLPKKRDNNSLLRYSFYKNVTRVIFTWKGDFYNGITRTNITSVTFIVFVRPGGTEKEKILEEEVK